MRVIRLLAALMAGGLLLTAAVASTEHGTKQDAVQLVQKALKHIESVGLEQALADFKTPGNPFQERDLYVFVYDFQGNNLANSTRSGLPYTNLKEVRSADGKLVVQEMIEMSKSSGGGAFEYDWLNPETGQVQSKISYFKKIPGFDGFIGAGYYEPEPEPAEPTSKEKAARLVQRALKHIESVGLEQALADFKTPGNAFQEDDLYVFVYDFDGHNLANSTKLEPPGDNLKDYRGPDGKLVIQEMIEMSRSSGGGAFPYEMVNPATGKTQTKISYFKRIPGFNGFIGAGYYLPDEPTPATDLCGKEEAVALVNKALDHIGAVGLSQALADFKTPGNPFQYRELYVFVYDYQGHNLANSTKLEPPSDNLKDYRSPDGKLVIQQMIEMTKASGGGAFEYDMINPRTQQTQSKISYFKKIPGFDGFIGCGYYRP